MATPHQNPAQPVGISAADDIDARLLQIARQMETLRVTYIDPSNERMARIEADLATGLRSINGQLNQILDAINRIRP